MSTLVMATPQTQANSTSLMPREHGATAMLLIPFGSAAILARQWRWEEVAALLAAACIFAAKDPLVVLARQRWVWKQRRPESRAAKRWLIGEGILLAACGPVLAATWPWWTLAAFGAGTLAFSALAVMVSVRNRQRSALFQIASACALTATSLACCLSATGAIQEWCWWLWALCALQATAGILVVHARLEARIAARKQGAQRAVYRVPAVRSCAALMIGSVAAGIGRQPWIAAALLMAAAGYLYELRRQREAASLQMPLTRLGLQAMSVSIAYAALVVAGLW